MYDFESRTLFFIRMSSRFVVRNFFYVFAQLLLKLGSNPLIRKKNRAARFMWDLMWSLGSWCLCKNVFQQKILWGFLDIFILAKHARLEDNCEEPSFLSTPWQRVVRESVISLVQSCSKNFKDHYLRLLNHKQESFKKT